MHISAEKKVSHVSLPIVKFSHDGSIASIILIFFCYIKCYNFFIVRIVRTRPYNISFKCKQGQLTYMYLEKKTPKKKRKKRRILLLSKCCDGSDYQHMVYKFIQVLHYIDIQISFKSLRKRRE